jgi:hypothetical protein
MKLFLSSIDIFPLKWYWERFPNAKPNLFKSYGHPSSDYSLLFTTYRSKIGMLALDSGAWTLNNSIKPKMPITIEGYREYLRHSSKNYDFYFNFDEDFTENGFNANWSNQVNLEKAELTPVPVVHNICNHEIDFYIERGYKLVALGSTQIVDRVSLETPAQKLHDAGVKVHLFGTTNINYTQRGNDLSFYKNKKRL